ncbi:MAG: hypothetical protein CSB44_08330 [Gammaproteobacteria bacterium]|nr:MAG: hypothetical protein CSB44_08330 [Gammaproteobacteria bacterium]
MIENKQTFRTLPRQRGLSLVELMIAMVLGLVLLAAGMNMYAGSTRSSRFSEGIQSMQDNGRYGISVLRQGLRLAGFSPSVDLEPLDLANSSSAQVTIRTAHPYDCNGQSTASTDGIAVNTYSYDSSSETITCTGNQDGSSAMPLVEGVEAFRILYGVDAEASDDSDAPQRYVAWNAGLRADEVSSLRIALLVNSGKAIRSRSVSGTYVVLDEEVTINDRMAREVFSSTVLLRNR